LYGGFFGGCAVSRAQKFQGPTQAELKMTDDPNSTEGPAVFRYREVIADNVSHQVSCYARIRVLTETRRCPPGYQGKPVIEGRTIHRDGSVCLLTVFSGGFCWRHKTRLSRSKKLVFNLPNVVVGSILAIRKYVQIRFLSLPGNCKGMVPGHRKGTKSASFFWVLRIILMSGLQFLHREAG
jgi:hypothetical protein